MPRQMVAILLSEPINYDLIPFRYFILSLNKIQSIYEFCFPDIELVLDQREYSEEHLLSSVAEVADALSANFDYSIAIITNSIEGNLFFTSRGKVAVITTDCWEQYFSPPSIFEYILHCVMASLLFMHPSLDLDSHLETRGCVLDYTRLKADDRIDIALGYICDSDCESIKRQVGEDYLKQIQSVISRQWIGAVNERNSVAFDLKHFFRFDIERDSGLNKTFWERTRAKLDDVPLEVTKTILQAVTTLLLAAVLLYLGLKQD
jgi:hypothetical protein